MKLIVKKKKDISVKNSDGIKLLKELSENTVDLIITDPPYRTTSKGCTGTTGGMLKKDICKTGKMFNYNDLSPKDYAGYMFKCLKEGGHCYIMCNHIWDKGNKIMGRFYMSQFEYILFFRKGKGIQINNCGTSDILSVPNKKLKDSDGKNLHDTQKPVELMSILIQNSSKKGELVVDPFAGIFTTAIACKRLGRRFLGCELDPTYFNIGTKLLRGE